MIDLPGLTYQGALIEPIRGMVKHFISNPNSIVLIIMPSTQDLTTSEAIELAGKEDPMMERSLVVVTKIDRAEKGFVNELDSLRGGLGVVCVRNRTQEEVDKKVSFEEVREREMMCFMEAGLNEIPEESRGTSQLISYLVKL